MPFLFAKAVEHKRFPKFRHFSGEIHLGFSPHLQQPAKLTTLLGPREATPPPPIPPSPLKRPRAITREITWLAPKPRLKACLCGWPLDSIRGNLFTGETRPVWLRGCSVLCALLFSSFSVPRWTKDLHEMVSTFFVFIYLFTCSFILCVCVCVCACVCVCVCVCACVCVCVCACVCACVCVCINCE